MKLSYFIFLHQLNYLSVPRKPFINTCRHITIMSPVSEGLELRYLVLLVSVVLASCILATVIGGLVVWAR